VGPLLSYEAQFLCPWRNFGPRAALSQNSWPCLPRFEPAGSLHVRQISASTTLAPGPTGAATANGCCTRTSCSHDACAWTSPGQHRGMRADGLVCNPRRSSHTRPSHHGRLRSGAETCAANSLHRSPTAWHARQRWAQNVTGASGRAGYSSAVSTALPWHLRLSPASAQRVTRASRFGSVQSWPTGGKGTWCCESGVARWRRGSQPLMSGIHLSRHQRDATQYCRR
jgi:hypothetical protein